MPKTAEARTFWIKARVRADELVEIEGRAAQSNRTVSEYIRDMALSALPAQPALTAVERHDLAQIAVAMKTGDRADAVLASLQAIIRKIDNAI